MEANNFEPTAIIKIVGVGGSGTNSVNNMIKSELQGVQFIVANTDKQALETSLAPVKIALGQDENSTARGLGAGANPAVGREAATSSLAEIKSHLKGADMVIITAGMGGGTGTGAAPIFAEAAKHQGSLVIAIVTTPFLFEGNKRKGNANSGIEELTSKVDAIITISNDKLLEQYGDVPVNDSFVYADTILKQTVKTLTDIIAIPAHINLDFADVKTVMQDKGNAVVGIGRAVGNDRATKAAIHAISSPIIETPIKGATDAIINISGSKITLKEINTAVSVITQAVGSNCNIIFGTSVDQSEGDEMYVSVIATGINNQIKYATVEAKQDAIKEIIETMEVDLQVAQTREFLLADPLPQTEKMTITPKVASAPFNSFNQTTTTRQSTKESRLPGWFSKKK